MEEAEKSTDHSNDLPLMANISDIHVYHYVMCLRPSMVERILSGWITLFCMPNKQLDAQEHLNSKSPYHQSEKSPTSANCDKFDNCRESECSDNCGEPSTEHSYSRISSTDNCSSSEPSFVAHALCSDSGEHSEVHHENPQEYSMDAQLASYDGNYPLLVESATERIGNNSEHLACPVMSKEFTLILDSDSIVVYSVKEVEVDEESLKNCFDEGNPVCKSDIWEISRRDGPDLCFSVEENCVKIWKKRVCYSHMFPKVVKIHYHTKPDGQSLKWILDQSKSLCVFTHGNWINNRSWFPSQDAPTAMATWQAEVKVTKGYNVIMSGDTNPSVTESKEGLKIFQFYSDFKMPTSTLSIAIGQWTESVINREKESNVVSPPDISERTIPYRVFLPRMLHESAPELHSYLPLCLQIVTDILGSHPFQRQDVLVVPRCFDSLGMASPSVLYLSQSVLAGDFSMCVRVAHEICHTWFGIVIGPRDWTEEWLTEGFCTYLEDIVHAKVMKLLGHHTGGIVEYRELRDILKYRTLAAEIENTSQGLQLLRPNKEEDDVRRPSENSVQYVKDGKNPDKRFMQVHYLKGYFLLRFLESIVGLEQFLEILKNYVSYFHGKLVSSEMSSDSLVLFLEMLLDEKKMSPYLLQSLHSRYRFMECNADVQHRWCELVIKHKVDKHYTDIKSFLVNHQAMGVYLYGELVLAGSNKLKQIAQASFHLIKSEMEPDSYKTVHAMLYGK
ncbi:hypothetical protein FSP39_008484 [Pinctada imbricata]|uniref:Peptidase M1 leukotriene A4 hydrolase/aminopeptidase C-terminal domain-containing protein n=1 Tax=Pinctada imbricata TaxID=66713 RepID=A0AA89BQ93_PINIB|nr:hypothetical protein FSP39_008484 [Pinctada imbricata]